MSTLLPHGRPLTRADLDRMPDDGHRYELVDGVLVVSPAPRPRHQRAAWELRDGSYIEVAHVKADEPYKAAVPFPVTVVPRDLVAERPVP